MIAFEYQPIGTRARRRQSRASRHCTEVDGRAYRVPLAHRVAGNRVGVLRSRYNKSRSELLAFFRAVLDTDNTVVETAEVIGHAVDWYAQGADFADALHLAACVRR